MSTIWRMKNIISAYRMSKYVRQNGFLHVCGYKTCPLLGKIAVNKIELFEKLHTKGDMAPLVNEYILVSELYAGKYFDTDVCLEDKIAYLYLKKQGTILTDSYILPYTPKNLWLEIWKDNKIVFSILYGIILALLGVGVTGFFVGLIKVLQFFISKV